MIVLELIVTIVFGGLIYFFLDVIGAAFRFPIFKKGRSYTKVLAEDEFQNRVVGMFVGIPIVVFIILNFTGQL